MRRVLATFLLVCFGILIPLGTASARVCLLDGSIHGAGFPQVKKQSAAKPDCCNDCSRQKEKKDCCAELKKLPDSTRPAGQAEVPVLAEVDLPPVLFILPPVEIVETVSFHPSVPIRGPDSPSAVRAVLAVWSI